MSNPARHTPAPKGLGTPREVAFAAAAIPVSIAPLILMATVAGVDLSSRSGQAALLVSAISSLLMLALIHRIYRHRLEAHVWTKAFAQMVTKDDLTQIGNRRALRDALLTEARRARRLKVPISLLVIDLDQFKPVNDTFGHARGDEVLRVFARLLVETTRGDVDRVFRAGGDEFAVLLPAADELDAQPVAERIRASFREYVTSEFPRETRLGCSIGVSRLGHDEAPRAWLDRADQAMYAAKVAGGGVRLHSGLSSNEIDLRRDIDSIGDSIDRTYDRKEAAPTTDGQGEGDEFQRFLHQRLHGRRADR